MRQSSSTGSLKRRLPTAVDPCALEEPALDGKAEDGGAGCEEEDGAVEHAPTIAARRASE
jgi:hypothetical protein